MSNYTPGPWEIEYDDLTEEWIVSWKTGSAEVGGLYAADQARLIAAAPEMLRLLKIVEPLIDEICMSYEPINSIKAVIAKTEGEKE